MDYTNPNIFKFPKPEKKEKKQKKPIKGKKHKLTKATEITKSIKLIVWERDLHKCIFCGKVVTWNYANAHLIKRSSGGLGIPENLFTACDECHINQDNGKKSKEMTDYAKSYLIDVYGTEWEEKDLVYKK